MAFGEQQKLVQHGVETGGRLVDGRDDGSAARCQLPEGLHQVHGCSGVQAGCGLVQHQHCWVDQQLMAHRHTFSLTSRDASPEEAACIATAHSFHRSNIGPAAGVQSCDSARGVKSAGVLRHAIAQACTRSTLHQKLHVQRTGCPTFKGQGYMGKSQVRPDNRRVSRTAYLEAGLNSKLVAEGTVALLPSEEEPAPVAYCRNP